MVLSGLRDDMWTEEHAATLDLFLKDVSKQLLVVYIDEFAGLKVEQTMPYQVCLALCCLDPTRVPVEGLQSYQFVLSSYWPHELTRFGTSWCLGTFSPMSYC